MACLAIEPARHAFVGEADRQAALRLQNLTAFS